MKRATRNFVGAFAAVVLLALVVPPLISMGRFHSRIDQSIGRALGRQVTIGEVNLRLLPQPGFDLQRLVVADDPSFSAEPALRADEVTAYLRLSSLWRGRLEIARLSLQNPSLNLVRGPNGRWNVYALLERTAQIPSAPTSQSKPETRPRFPYIEADSGRINFKVGAEKKVYALTDADFALWQEAENKWNFRVAARPVRTDENLSDTGTLKLEGSFQRAPSLRETPVSVKLNWQNGQLGQLTELIYGRDRGWRGALDLSAELSGTPASLAVRADARVQDFRRYDIITPGSLQLRARCGARFSSIDQSWSHVACRAPVQDGLLTVNGNAVAPLSGGPYQFKMVAQQLPMQSVVAAARHAKRDLPEDLTASGTLNASFLVSKSAETGWRRSWSGDGQTSEFVLSSDLTGNQLRLGAIPFTVVGGDGPLPARTHRPRLLQPSIPPELRMALGPFRLQLDGGAPAVLYASLSRSGYEVNLQGDAQLPRLEQVARTLGVHAPPHAKKGTARLDLQIAGLWTGFPAPAVTGKAQLRNLSAELKGVAAPLQISSAELVLAPQKLMVQNLAAGFAGSGMHLSGSVQLQRHCPTGETCPAQVNLHADQLVAAELENLLHPRLNRPWYRLLQREREKPLAGLLATGSLSANRVIVGRLAATRFSSRLSIYHGEVRLSQVRAGIWGGQHEGEWLLDFSGRQPVYSGTGALANAALADAAQTMGDDWATGRLSLQYRLKAAGWSKAELAASLASSTDFDVRDGVMHHLSLVAAAKPLRLRRFTGRLALEKGEFTISTGKLQAGDGIYQVSGTALLDSKLNIKLVRDSSHSFDITGTLGAPKVTAVSHPQTEAALTK
ncbi:MAG TPA: AsmA family protein [Terriglobales bacterium]|nr:AsmA family protein [Terriglobales bacterium]